MNLIRKAISAKRATTILIGLFVLVLIFHGLVLAEVIPFTVAWGGRLKTYEEMVVFETISIFVNVFLILILLIRAEIIFAPRVPKKIIGIILWAFIVLFALNTVGNLFAKNLYEQLIATPLTFLTTILLLIIVTDKEGAKL